MFLEELAGLKNRYLDRLRDLSFPRGRGGRDRTVQRPARPRQMRRGFRHAGRCRRDVDAFFICGPGPMMDAAEAALHRARRRAGAHPHRALHHRHRLGRAARAQMQALQQKAAGHADDVTLDGRSVEGRVRCGEGQHPRQRARRRPARALSPARAASARPAAPALIAGRVR